MPKLIATYDTVAQAAETLLAQGQDPTLITIQERIGGSFSTMKRHLDVWLEQRQSAQAIQVPAGIMEQGASLVRDIWRAAEAQTGQTINAMKAETERLVAAADQRAAEALEAIERLEQTNEAQASTITTMQSELEQQRSHAIKAQADRATAVAQAQSAEQRATSLASDLAQARSELTIQTKIAGEVEALRKQVADLQGMIERMGKPSTKKRSA